MNLFLKIAGRRREASRVRRSIELEGAEVIDGVAVGLVRVSHDAKLGRLELEAAQRQGSRRFHVRMSLLDVRREQGLEDVNLASSLFARASIVHAINQISLAPD